MAETENERLRRRIAALEAETASLRAAQRRDRAIFGSAVDFAIIAADRDGLITDWNTGAERIFGWTAAELCGRPADTIFTPEDKAAGVPEREMALAREAGRASDERWHVQKDGSRFWANGEMMPLRGDGGAHLGYLKILQDRTDQRRVAAALREAETLNALILNSSPDCIVVLDLDGHILFVSPGGVDSMEISDREAILGSSWLLPWKGGDHESAVAAVEAARAGGTGRFQGFRPTYKGTPKWWDMMISPLPGADGKPERLVSVGRDITGTVEARRRLDLSEESLRLAIEAAGLGTWDLDLATNILTWSDRTKAMFGIAPDGTCSMDDFYAALHPDDREATATAFAAALDPALRSTYDVEYRAIGRDDGVTRWIAAKGRGLFDGRGRCLRAIGTTIDITARKAAEAELRALNATLESRIAARSREIDRVWRLSQDVLAIVEMDATIAAINAVATALLGWETDELVGLAFPTLVHPEDLETTLDVFEGIFAAPLVDPYEFRLRHKDGTYRWFAWTGAFEDGKVYANGRHTTAEHEQAEALLQAEAQLRQSQKMQAIGQLTGGIAHDFNNLLTGISGSLELLQARVAQGRTSDLGRYLAAAQGAAARAAALIHRLLAFARQQTLDPKPTSVNRLAAGMEELIRRTMGPAITVEMVLASGLWPTLCDPNQLENALLNLCINARDAMPEGGRLTVETSNRWFDERAAQTREIKPGQYVSLCVSDNGSGMTPEVMARAFEPFFTTKPIGEGTGLGLSMIYGFARQSGGQARIYSEPGEGTMVCIYLPRHYGAEDAVAEPARHIAAPAAVEGETVLVVDDEPTVRMLVTDVLDDLGYNAIEAADAASGLAVLQSDARIDLLITDIGLPGRINGRQMAEAARQARPDLQVLFITGFAENALIGHSQLLPGTHVLTKPFAMETLASRIRSLIES